jgi:hypothetical protein
MSSAMSLPHSRDQSRAPRLSLATCFVRVRSRVGVSMGDLPLAVLSPVDLRHTENVPPRLAVDGRLRPLVPAGESYVTDHVRSDDLVHVRGAVLEGVGEVVEQVAYGLLTDCRRVCASIRNIQTGRHNMMIEFLAQSFNPVPSPSPLTEPSSSDAAVEIIRAVFVVVVGSTASYLVGRKQGSDKAKSDFEAREHQAEIDRRARKEAAEEDDRRRLHNAVRPLIIELEDLATSLSRWRERDEIAAAHERWFSELRGQVAELALRRVPGEEELIETLREVRWAFGDLSKHADLLTRQQESHPHRSYTWDRYSRAQEKVDELLNRVSGLIR